MTDFSKARINMVDGQISTAGVVNDEILESFKNTPRELFVPEKLRNVAYSDDSLDIGQGRYLLSPMIYAKMLQAVEPKEGDVVLDIASASGYSCAILSPLVTTVIALECNKRQMDKASKLWTQLGTCNIALINGKINEGVPDQAPYSLIIINGAVTKVPKEIINQMGPNSRLITVIKKDNISIGHATLFLKNINGNVSHRKVFDANIPILEEFKSEPKFKF